MAFLDRLAEAAKNDWIRVGAGQLGGRGHCLCLLGAWPGTTGPVWVAGSRLSG